MIKPVSGEIVYFTQDGRLTYDGLALMQDIIKAVNASSDGLTAIAAVTAPAGGATVDAESRTAISAIIAAAT